MPSSAPKYTEFAMGLALGRLSNSGLLFEPEKDFRACLICGAVYQSTLDRYPNTPNDLKLAGQRRGEWIAHHFGQHTDLEIEDFREYGISEVALQRLANYGLHPHASATA